MIMKKSLLLLTALIITINITAQQLNVAAAANLRFVLEEIKTEYLKLNPSSKVNITFGSSGNLVQQILNGASFEFFMAADNQFPLKLKEKGATYGDMKTYAFGKLAMYSTSIDLSNGIETIDKDVIKKIAIAKPETAPYGDRAVELLKNTGRFENLKSKIVYGDNISQAAQYAFTGNVEIGFVALSLALAPDMKGKGYCHVVDQSLYKPVEQACILIKRPVACPEAKKFMNYVLSSQTKSIWEKYGYSSPSN